MPALRYIALRTFTIGAVTYNLGDEVDVTGMSSQTLSGLSSMGWVATSTAGNVGRITVDATAPAAPALNDIWVDTSA